MIIFSFLLDVVSYQSVNGGDVYWRFLDDFVKEIDGGKTRFKKIKDS